MADYFLKNVKCPFFLEGGNNRQNSIKCEGIKRGTSLHLVFKRSRAAHYEKYCCNNYTNCSIYQMLEQKYKK